MALAAPEPSAWYRQDWTERYAEWLYVLTPGARIAWEMLKGQIKATAISQKNPNRAARLMPSIAAIHWNVPIDAVREMETAATESGALSVEGGCWVVTDRKIFQSERTVRREERFEDEPIPQPAEAFGGQIEDLTGDGGHSCRVTITVPVEEKESLIPEEERGKGMEGETVSVFGGQTDGLAEEQAIKAKNADKSKKVKRSEFFISMLPESHRTPRLADAIASNFRMRTEKRVGPLTEETMRTRARDWSAEFSADEIAVAFEEATLAGWTGVFPKKARSPTNGKVNQTTAEALRAGSMFLDPSKAA